MSLEVASNDGGERSCASRSACRRLGCANRFRREGSGYGRGCAAILQAISRTRQLVAGVGALHTLGIVHRDVCLENLFLQGKEEVLKLLDFGSARSLLMAAAQSGSTSWPREPRLKHRVDLYGAGLVLAALLAGRDLVPHESQLAELLVGRPVRSMRALLTEGTLVIGAIGRALLGALSRDVSSRFRTAAEFNAALHSVEVLLRRRP